MRKLIVVASVARPGATRRVLASVKPCLKALVAKSLSNMVPVKGGEFLMGILAH